VETREEKRILMKKNIGHYMVVADDLLTRIEKEKKQQHQV
jgi:hypothetical protein